MFVPEAQAAEIYQGPVMPAMPGKLQEIKSYLEGKTDKIDQVNNPCDVAARKVYNSIPGTDKHFVVGFKPLDDGTFVAHTVVLSGGKVFDPLFSKEPIPLKDYKFDALQISNESSDGIQWNLATPNKTFLTPNQVGQ